ARQHLHLGHARAKAREGLGELAADRPAAEDDEAPWQLAQIPYRVGCVYLYPLDAGQRRHDRAGTGSDDDGARAEGAAAVDLHSPRRGDARFALEAFHTQRGIALDRVVRLDRAHHALHALHYLGEIEFGLRRS